MKLKMKKELERKAKQGIQEDEQRETEKERKTFLRF
jgi:hypothetical protein